MMNIMGVIPYERYTQHTGKEENARHAQIMSIHRVPQGEEDSQNEQNHPKKLWESTYKNHFTQFNEHKIIEEQNSFKFDNTVDVLELSQEALELFWGNGMANIQA